MTTNDTTNGMYLVHCKVFLLSIMLEIQESTEHTNNVLFCATFVRILYSHTYRQARKYLCLDTVIYRFVVTCKRLHAQQ